jgi:hypothetical protein
MGAWQHGKWSGWHVVLHSTVVMRRTSVLWVFWRTRSSLASATISSSAAAVAIDIDGAFELARTGDVHLQ